MASPNPIPDGREYQSTHCVHTPISWNTDLEVMAGYVQIGGPRPGHVPDDLVQVLMKEEGKEDKSAWTLGFVCWETESARSLIIFPVLVGLH